MSLYVKIEEGEVTQVIDTAPPADEEGWFPAVQVNEPHANRQGRHGHHFDITKNPVEIIHDIFDIAVEDRKLSMIDNANFVVNFVKNSPQVATEADVAAAEVKRDLLIDRINAAADHDELDRIQVDM